MLKDKVVIVTGSAQGIGKHAARTFAQEQAKVVIADFNEDNAKKTAAELGKLADTLAICVDVRDEESVKRMVDQVIDRFSRIDVHINNAAIVPHFAWGIPRWPRISEMPMDFWNRVVQTILYGTFLGTKHVLPHMDQAGAGNVINTSSVAKPGAVADLRRKHLRHRRAVPHRWRDGSDVPRACCTSRPTPARLWLQASRQARQYAPM